MTANIFGERFLGYRQPAWHKKGTVITTPMSVPDAVRTANCDYNVFKSPVVAEVDNVNVPGLQMSTGSTPLQIPDRYVITREPTFDDPEFKFFGFVSGDYEVLDNVQIADALDVLTDTWRVETVGALDDGKVLFIALDAGEIELVPGGDERVHNYFVFTDRKDGRQKARFMFTPVRVVCQNTLIMGERQSRVNAQIEHRQGATDQLMLRVDIIDKLIKKQELSIERLKQLASVKITNEDASRIINAVYPMPKAHPDMEFADMSKALNTTSSSALAEELFAIGERKAKRYEYRTELTQAYREGAMTLFNTINDEHASIAMTPYAVYNAVVELADWREGRGDIEYSTMFGERAREKMSAFALAERAAVRASKS